MENYSFRSNLFIATLLAITFLFSSEASRVLVEDSQLRQAQNALSESLESVKATCDFVIKLSTSGSLQPREAAAVKDCMETLSTSVDELHSSVEAMGSIARGSGPELKLKMDNVQTWVSAALTNEDTCMDGFSGVNGEVKTSIRARIVKVAKMTSNALALVNNLA